MQQPMNDTDYMHLAGLSDSDWHPICLCRGDCGLEPCVDECCKCTGKQCAALLHTWYIEGYEQFWPYYTYYKHGEDVVKFYYSDKWHGPFHIPLGGILSEWISKLHTMEVSNSCTTHSH